MKLARVLFLLLLWAALPAWAGRSCEPREAQAAELGAAVGLGEKLGQALDRSGARVALVARAGQDLSKYGLRYSHVAITWRDHPKGRWTVVHLLNECGTARSDLHDEGLGGFFLDVHRPDAAILYPSEALQARLEQVLRGPLPRQLHEPRYNMLAFPFATKYQNSNQWVLELLAAASARDISIGTRAQAQDWLKATGFEASTIELGTLARLGGRMFRANVAFDDHPFGRRMAGHIDTVTVDSVFRFLRRRDPDSRTEELLEDRWAPVARDPSDGA